MLDSILKLDSYIVDKYKNKKIIDRDIYKSFDSKNDLVWIVGLRWVGKTTYLLKERIKTKDSIYISCDFIELKNISLFSLVEDLKKTYWYTTFYLDEIHFIDDWSWNLKNISDFLWVKVIFSWSNMINILKLWHDLSRRLIKYELSFFSFREYIEITKWIKIKKESLNNILTNHVNIAKNNINWYSKNLFIEYLKFGQFWYWYEYIWDKIDFRLKLENSIKKSIYEDLSDFVDIMTSNLKKVEDILFFIANTSTTEITINSLSKKVGLSIHTCEIYINFLDNLWLLYVLDYYGTITDNLKKSKKIVLSNTNFIYLFSDNIWVLRESFFVSQVKNNFNNFYHLKKTDFVWIIEDKKIFFEIWWKNKKRKDDVFIIKDDIEIWNNKEIPLWLFWLIK
jgi:uncharacterized protein